MQLDLFQQDHEPSPPVRHRDNLFPARRTRPHAAPPSSRPARAPKRAGTLTGSAAPAELERASVLDTLRAEAERYAAASYADRTRRARQRDWDTFARWCAE